MTVNDALHSCQADAGACELGRSMKPLERAKQLVGVGHVKTHTVVAYDVHRVALLLGHTELDPGLCLLASKLPGITQQVHQHYPKEVRIGVHDQLWRDDKLYLMPWLHLLKLGCYSVRQSAEVNGCAAYVAARHA